MMQVIDGLIYGLIMAALYIGLIILTGFIIALINKLFYKIVGRSSHTICVLTGFIGTPIHELGHAFFCLLFGHKIVEIKLYQPSSSDGTLGYVSHSYNKKNLYQRIGNFFIGVGPIIFGSMVLLLFLLIFSRDTYDCLNSLMKFYTTQVPSDYKLLPKFIFGGLIIFIEEFFSSSNFTSFSYLLFLVLSMFISLHMCLSKADIDGALTGLFFTIILFIAPSIIVSLIFRSSYTIYIGYLISGAIYISSIYMLSITLSLIPLIIAIIIKLIKKIFKK